MWDHFCDRPFLFLLLCQVQSVLGLELLECLYWRRGALLYMYCHTLHQRKQWIKKNKGTFLKVGLQNPSFPTSSHSPFIKAFGQFLGSAIKHFPAVKVVAGLNFPYCILRWIKVSAK